MLINLYGVVICLVYIVFYYTRMNFFDFLVKTLKIILRLIKRIKYTKWLLSGSRNWHWIVQEAKNTACEHKTQYIKTTERLNEYFVKRWFSFHICTYVYIYIYIFNCVGKYVHDVLATQIVIGGNQHDFRQRFRDTYLITWSNVKR